MKTKLSTFVAITLALCLENAIANSPSPYVGLRANKPAQVLALNNTGQGYTVPIYFGDPVQIVG